MQLEKVGHQVSGHLAAVLDAGPHLNWRVTDELIAETNRAKVVVQVFSLSAVLRVAGHADAGRALVPMANTADVLTSWIGEKDIRSSVLGLCSAFEPSRFCCKSGEVKIICDRDEDVCIFRISFVRRQRPDQSDSQNAIQRADRINEAKGFGDKECSNCGIDPISTPSVTHGHDDAPVATSTKALRKKWIVHIGGKDHLAVIAALNDVLALPRNDETRKTCHAAGSH